MTLVAALLINVLYAFISPHPTNVVTRFAYRLTEPVLAPIRRRLPPMSGFDLSPMVVMLGAYLLISILRNIA